MAINNPYIPGDPYSYDLKWIVAKVKEILAQLGTLDEAIEAKIFEGFLEHSVVQFKTVPEMLAADITDGSIVLTLGYHEAGDQGGLFYLVKDFNPSQCALDYFLTLDNNQQIAIPVIVTPYVTPEMFGAYGDAINDDTDAIRKAFNYGVIRMTKKYKITDTVDIMSDQKVLCDGEIFFDIDQTGFSSTVKLFSDDRTSNFSWYGGKIYSTGAAEPNYLSIFYFENAENITFENVKFENVPVTFCISFWRSKNLIVKDCYINHYSYGGICFYDGSENGLAEGNTIKNLDVPGNGTGYPLSLSGGLSGSFSISKNIRALHNVIDNSETIARWEGIDAHGGDGLIIAENIIRGCITGIMAANGDQREYDLIRTQVVNNIVYGRDDGSAGYGLAISGKDVIVDGNIVEGFTQTLQSAGIYTRFSDGIVYRNNRIKNCSCGVIFSKGDGPVKFEGNTFEDCGRYPNSGAYPAIREFDQQTYTEFIDNTFIRSQGEYDIRSYALNDVYLRFSGNRFIDSVNSYSSGTNTFISDIRSGAPTQSDTRMGKLGDVCKLAAPRPGYPYEWICTAAWDPSTQTVTWTALPNL